MLTITIEDLGESVILQCRGKIVRGEETRILCVAIRHHGRDLSLDLRHVEAIDAAGIGVLLSLQAAGIYLKLMNPTGPVREVLRLTKLDSVFEIFEAEICESERIAEIKGAGMIENRSRFDEALPRL